MPNFKNDTPPFRMIRGGLHHSCRFGTFQIHASPEKSPPFPVGARVYEEDTWLTISAEPGVAGPPEHPIRMMTGLIEARPEPVGSVLVRERDPLELLAVVHDVDQEPTWRPEWVRKALEKVFQLSEGQKLESVALPLLGTQHGRLRYTQFAAILLGILNRRSIQHLKRIWLVAPVGANQEIIEIIQGEIKA